MKRGAVQVSSSVDPREILGTSRFVQAAAAAGSEGHYRGLLSAELAIARAEADHLARAGWSVGADNYPLRLHFVRRARQLSARAGLLEGVLGGPPDATPTPHTAALIAMHHHAASRHVGLLLAWEWSRGGPAAQVLEGTAEILRARWVLPTPITSLFEVGAPQGVEALMASHPAEGSEQFISDVLTLFCALLDEIFSVV